MIRFLDRLAQALRALLPGQRRRWLWLGGLSATALLLLNRPAQAYQVQFTPSSPQLGDTIAVVIRSDSERPPTVSVRGQTYPAFPVTAGQFRALVPTSPLDAPGRLTVQVSGDEGERNLAVGLRDRSFQTQYITLSPGRAGLEGTDYEFARMDALKALRTPEQYWSGPMARPSNGRVSSVYGLRRYYNGVFA
ncbi:MAG: M23 family peptidase, partial [Leptolyngbya sp. SIO4C1]|nr:M23 family peptidase [Leptolyngbya sp. SIO4C1]